MPAPSRAFLFLLVGVMPVVPACPSKSDVPEGGDCTTACDSGDETSSGSGAADDDGEVDTSPTTAGTGPTTVTGDPTGADASTSGGSTGDDTAGSSTGEAVDDTYLPCMQDADCGGGLCFHGFCTVECWSQEAGETPCPAPPEGSGIVVSCDRIGVIGVSHWCETSTEAPKYCIPTCTENSSCPGHGSCVTDLCSVESFCGLAPYELDDASCSDGIDNDDDGYVDCDDFDCSMSEWVTVCGSENDDAACSNGDDDDGDGYIDCDDFDCSMNPMVTVC